MEFIEFPWCWDSIGSNPNLTLEFVKSQPVSKWKWWSLISKHPNITMEMIQETPDLPWDWSKISGNSLHLDYFNDPYTR